MPSVALGCFAVVAAAAFLYAHRFGADWIYGDDLLTVGWIARIRAGTLDGQDLLALWDNQHPVGAQTALTWLLFRVVGIHFKAVVYLSFALILATAAFAWRLARPAAASPGVDAVLCLSMTLLALHPNQMEHLLWAFELGWFMVNGCVVANVWLVERSRGRALVPVAALCLVATFSSAQGAFAWLVAAFHILLLGNGRRRWAASAVFAACGLVAIVRIAARSAAIGQDQPSTFEALAGLPVFALQILGSELGTRNHAGLLVAGVALLGLVAALGLRLGRQDGDPERLRCAAVLVTFSALCVMSFARGRSAFGLDWALGSFHAAPLLVPFGFGAVLLLADAARAVRHGDRLAAIVATPLAALLVAGWLLSSPYGLKRARLWRMDRGYAAWAACGGEVPFETARKAAGGEPYGDALATGLQSLSPMCATGLNAFAPTLTTEPALFRDLAASHPEWREALSVVWQDYATEILLQLAFDPERPDAPARLIALAKAEAARGAPFDHARWAPYAAVLHDLP